MFVLLSAAYASLMALPVLQTGTLEPLFKAEMNEGGAAAVQVRLVVSPAGVGVACTRAFVNGPAGNAEALCSMLLTHVRFAPARDSLGRPAFGVIYIWSHWEGGRWKGSAMPSWDPVDLALQTNQAPTGFADGSIFRLVLQVDARGKVEDCAVSTIGLTSQLIELLCGEAGIESINPATDGRGTVVPSVQEFLVRLTSEAPIK